MVEWGPDEARGDQRLADYFVEVPEYKSVIAGTKRYVIGRKGTGKTAILERIRIDAARNPTWFISALSLRNFPITTIRTLRIKSHRDKSQFVPVWMFLIASELTRLVLQDPSAGPADIIGELRNFAESNGSVFGSGIAETLSLLETSGGQVSASPTWIEGQTTRSSSNSREHVHYHKVTKALIARLRRVHAGSSYFVLMDELDEGYKTRDSSLRLLLLSLLRATEDLSIELNKAPAQFRLVLALRSDIYDSLDDNDINKLDDAVLRLNWSSILGRNALSLREVVDARIRSSIPGGSWDKVVTSGPQGLPKGVGSIWKYLLSRTYDRPRDVVKFLKICRKGMSTSGKLTARIVESAELEYSNWLYNEIGNEIHATLEEWKTALQCLGSVGRGNMTSEQLQAAMQGNQRMAAFIQRNPEWTTDRVMETLFDFGIIGNMTDRKVWLFRYKDLDLPWNPNLRVISHWGLNKKLRILRDVLDAGSFQGEEAMAAEDKHHGSSSITTTTKEQTAVKAPTCFISYSWDSDDHKAWVLALAAALRTDMGVEVKLDQWGLRPGEILTSFMEHAIEDSDYTVLVCTPKFARDANSGTAGIGYEKNIVTAKVYDGHPPDRFIPILRMGERRDAIPTYLKGKLFVDFRKDAEFKSKLEELGRAIHKKPRTVAPPLGKPPF